MKLAYHQSSSRHLSVEEYVTLFGPKLNQYAQKRIRDDVICSACEQALHTVGENGPLRDATWAHYPKNEGVWCPMKEKSAAKYEVLPPTSPNELVGTHLRNSFFKNWKLHWAQITEIVPLCDIFTLIEFIKYADNKKLWQQVGLKEWFFPYIFLATCEFPPTKSKDGKYLRSEWIRCRFDFRVRTSEDLWIRTEGDWGFIKAEYVMPPRAKEPRLKHLLSVTKLTPDKNFLTKVSPAGNVFQIENMKKAFPIEVP